MMDFLRGLFGSSARQNMAVTPGETSKADFGEGSQMERQYGAPELQRAPTMTPDGNPERSFLGGLIKYQRPEGRSGADQMALLGATLGDMGAGLAGGQGGGLAHVQDQFRRRSEKTKQDEEMTRLKGMAAELYPDDPDAQFLFSTSPESFVQAQIKRRTPELIEGDDGIYEVADGKSRLVQKYEPDAPKAPMGYRWDGEKLAFVPGGPADPSTWEGKRRVVVDNPMPRRGGGGSGGGRPKAPPSGFLLDP